METLGSRVRACRKKLHLSQQALADRIGQSKNSISLYENGLRHPSGETLSRLSLTLQVSADYLLGLAALATGREQNARSLYFTEDACDYTIEPTPFLKVRMPDDSLAHCRICKGDLLFIRPQPRVHDGGLALVRVKRALPAIRYVSETPEGIVLHDGKSACCPPLRPDEVRVIGEVRFVQFAL